MGFESILVKGILAAAFLVGLFLIIPTKREAEYIFRGQRMTLLAIVNELSQDGQIIGTSEKAVVLEYENQDVMLQDIMRFKSVELDYSCSGNILNVMSPVS